MARRPECARLILFLDNDPVAYGEIWVDSDAGEVELGRIIVKPTFRRHGIGRKLMACLLEEAGRAGFRDAFLRVHPGNTNAIACYEGAGFSRVSFEHEQLWNRGQPAEYLWFQRNV